MAAPLDAISRFLLKHPPEAFARGEVVLAPVVPVVVAVVLMAAGVAGAAWMVRALQGTSRRDRWLLGGLRAAAFVLIGVCLLRPTLVFSRAVAQRNVLVVLADDSRSMQLADVGGMPRVAAMQAALADSGAVMRALADRFVVRVHRMDDGAEHLPSLASVAGTGTRSDIGAALSALRDRTAGLPVAGVVLVSDGHDNGTSDLDAELRRWRARGVPVHTVGVGASRPASDVALEGIALPPSVLEGGEAVGEARLRAAGLAGARIAFEVEAGGRLVHLDTLVVPESRDLFQVPIRIPPLAPGAHAVRVRARAVPADPLPQNDAAVALLTVRAGPERILHVEGEPRAELPFLRRALSGDTAVELVSLVRSAPGKYLRLGVRDSLELRTGFPTTRAELFRYRGLLLGSVEAAFFSADQLRMLEEFVRVRGGGFLALGGRRALAEGGFAGTAVAAALPVALDPVASGEPAVRVVHPVPTDAGLAEPALHLEPSRDAGRRAWAALPAVTTVNRLGPPRPGATVLLEGRDSTAGGRAPLVVTHRYGAGRATVFAVQDAWRWRLNPVVAEDDSTLARLWPRLARWMLADAPDQVEAVPVRSVVGPGEAAAFDLTVRDAAFLPTDRARIVARVIPPDAPPVEVPTAPLAGRPGGYRALVATAGAGAYRLDVTAILDGDSVAARPAWVLADAGAAEPGSGTRDDALLARVAEGTGGGTFDLAALDGLPEAASVTPAGITAREAHDLWDAPAVLLLLLGVVAADWTLRRRRGLA